MLFWPNRPESIEEVLSAKPFKSEDMEDMSEVSASSLEERQNSRAESFIGSLIACKFDKNFFFAAAGLATSLATALASRATSLASEVNLSRKDCPNTESLCCDCDRENTDDMEIARERVGVDVPEERSMEVDGDIGRTASEARGVELLEWSEVSEPTDSMGERPEQRHE